LRARVGGLSQPAAARHGSRHLMALNRAHGDSHLPRWSRPPRGGVCRRGCSSRRKLRRRRCSHMTCAILRRATRTDLSASVRIPPIQFATASSYGRPTGAHAASGGGRSCAA